MVKVSCAEHDARLWNDVGGACGSEVYLFRTVLTHIENVVHDGSHVFLTCAVVTAALVDMAVGKKYTAEPNVLDETETICLVVIGKYL